MSSGLSRSGTASSSPLVVSCAAWKPRSSSYRACSTCSARRSLTSFWNLRLSARRPARRCCRGTVSRRRSFQQQAHGGGDGAASGLHHVRHAEIQPAGAFAARGGDQAQRRTVEEQASRRAGAAQQPFHAPVGGGVRAALGADYGVEGFGGGGGGDQQLPRGFAVAVVRWRCVAARRLRVRGLARCRLAHCELRAQGLAGVRQMHFQLRRQRRFGRAGVGFGGEAPVQHVLREGAEVRQHGLRRGVAVDGAFLHARSQPLLAFGVVPVERGAVASERRAETTRPVGRTKPSHSRWAAMDGSGVGMGEA